jgi:hypothetical protein
VTFLKILQLQSIMLISFFPILKILLNQIINFGILDFNWLIFCDNVFCLRLLINFLSKKLCLKPMRTTICRILLELERVCSNLMYTPLGYKINQLIDQSLFFSSSISFLTPSPSSFLLSQMNQRHYNGTLTRTNFWHDTMFYIV